MDTAGVARTLGHTGRVNGGVYQVNAPRPETIRDNGMTVPNSMGLGTVMNFQPTGGGTGGQRVHRTKADWCLAARREW